MQDVDLDESRDEYASIVCLFLSQHLSVSSTNDIEAEQRYAVHDRCVEETQVGLG